MTVRTVALDEPEWQLLLFVLANAEGKGITWGIVNPLLMKIGAQLQVQQQGPQQGPPPPIVVTKQTNADGKEAGHE